MITDQTMPKMTGAELAQGLIRIKPDIKVILCTGFSDVIAEDKAKEPGIRDYIMKPILINELVANIRHVLD